MYSYELYHHGVKGMKWGVRRSLKKVDRKANRQNWSDDARNAAKIKTKKVKQMSNDELKQLNERTRLERDYSSLNPNKIKKGMRAASGIAVGLGTILTLQANGSKVIELGKNLVNKIVK